jgi:hypothetical protein
MKVMGIALCMLALAACTTSPLERMTSAAQELVSAVNEGQVEQCKGQALQATALGQLLQPSDLNQPSVEMQSLQKLLQRFLGG